MGVLIQLSAKFPVLGRFNFPQFTGVPGNFAKRLLQAGMQLSARKNRQNGAGLPKAPFRGKPSPLDIPPKTRAWSPARVKKVPPRIPD